MRTAYRVARVLVVVGLALLPTMAAAKPPAPKGDLVYQDDFAGAERSGLEDNVSAADYQRGFHPPGVYHLKLNAPNEVRFSLLPNQSYSQFSAEAEVWDNSDTFQGDVAQGLVFRAQDDTHLYAALVDPRTGQYSVRKLDGGEWSDLIAMTDSPLVKGQENINLLRVDGDGQNFTVYLNGEQLATFSDAAYTKGGLGMIVANIDAVEPHMHFDNFKIYSTEAAPAAAPPAALPQSGAAQGLAALTLAALAALLLLTGASLRRAVR